MKRVSTLALLAAVSVAPVRAEPAHREHLCRADLHGPAQGRAAPFTLSEGDSTSDTLMFVNMAHDFPKRVAYKKVDASTLLAWIDAGPKGSLRVEFPMRRVECPSGRED